MNVGFCEKYEKLIRKFWWGEDGEHRKVHWMAWDKMVKPKRAGGIGFRDMQGFNQALLARQAWRLIQNPDSLCARVLKSKYFHDASIWTATQNTPKSAFWSSILKMLPKLRAHSFYQIT